MRYYLITFEVSDSRKTTPWAGSIVDFVIKYPVDIIWSLEITEEEYGDVMLKYSLVGKMVMKSVPQ